MGVKTTLEKVDSPKNSVAKLPKIWMPGYEVLGVCAKKT